MTTEEPSYLQHSKHIQVLLCDGDRHRHEHTASFHVVYTNYWKPVLLGWRCHFCVLKMVCVYLLTFLGGGWEKWGRTAKDLLPARLNKGPQHAREYFQKTPFQLCSTLSCRSESLVSKFVKMKAESNILHISKTSPSTLSCFNIKSQHLLYP